MQTLKNDVSIALPEDFSLSDSEKSLLESMMAGRECDLSSKDEPGRRVRAEVIAAACARPFAESVHPRGLKLVGAAGAIVAVAGKLDLCGYRIPFGLYFRCCTFQEEIDLEEAHVRSLSLTGCTLEKDFKAWQLKLDGSLGFAVPEHPDLVFTAKGKVDVSGAKVGGQWACDGGKFLYTASHTEEDKCIFAQGIEVKRDVFMGNGFEAEGRVNLSGAKIGGAWSCDGGKFLHKGENCIFAQGIDVKQSVFMRNGFEAEGQVDLNGATLRANLVVYKADFGGIRDYSLAGGHDLKRVALVLFGARIEGRLVMDRVKSAGGVCLRRASVEQGLTVKDSRLGDKDNGQADALDLSGATVRKHAKIDNTTLNGALALSDADLQSIECEADFLYATDDERNGWQKLHNFLGKIKVYVWWPFLPLFVLAFPAVLGWAASIAALGLWLVICLFLLIVFLGAGRHEFLLRRRMETTHPKSSWRLGGVRFGSLDENTLRALKPEPLIRWLDVTDNGVHHPEPYLLFASVLERQGSEDLATAVRIAERRARRRKELWLRWWEWPLLDITIGYGYKPWKALIMGMWIIWAGWLVFDWAHENRLMTTAISDVLAQQVVTLPKFELPRDHPPLKPLLYSLDTFLPIVDLRQSEYWLPKPEEHLLWWAVWIETTMGWLLSTLLAAALIGVLQRTRASAELPN